MKIIVRSQSFSKSQGKHFYIDFTLTKTLRPNNYFQS